VIDQSDAFSFCCRMFVMEIAVIKFSATVIWVLGFCMASAKQSSEIYCGGNTCLDFIFHFLILTQFYTFMYWCYRIRN